MYFYVTIICFEERSFFVTWLVEQERKDRNMKHCGVSHLSE
jgi:hypothetical protein